LDVGSDVHVVLDWERRYDHMQQHSGQHLLSALGEQHFGWDTTSWWLGETLCNVEFNPTKKEFPINSTNLLKLESMVNDIIRENRTVQARIVEEEEKEQTNPVESDDRKSTDRHHGSLRVVEINGVDINPCCGTHISHTSELQVMKLFGSEKARGNIKVFFLFGQRVVNYLEEMFQREVKLRGLLSCGSDEFVETVTRSQSDAKFMIKENKSLKQEVSEYRAKDLVKQAKDNNSTVISLLMEDSNLQSLLSIAQIILKEYEEAICLLACGNPKGEGQFVVVSSKLDVAPIGKEIATCLDGRGGGKGTRFQGKVNNLSKFNDAIEIVKKYQKE